MRITKITKNLFLIVTLFASATVLDAKIVETKKINIEKSILNWTGNKLLSNHTGTIKFLSGSIELNDKKQIVGGEFQVDMNSLLVTDIDGDDRKNLERHLKSPDFFNVSKYSKSTLRIKKVKKKGDDYNCTGDLTIKGITHSVEFVLSGSEDKKGIDIQKFSIDRTKWDIRYNSTSFFKGLADNYIIKNEFDLEGVLKF